MWKYNFHGTLKPVGFHAEEKFMSEGIRKGQRGDLRGGVQKPLKGGTLVMIFLSVFAMSMAVLCYVIDIIE